MKAWESASMSGGISRRKINSKETTKKTHPHTLVPLFKDGSGLQLMHSLKCQDIQIREPQLSFNELEPPI